MSRLITDIMRECRNGKHVHVASEKFNELIEAVAETDKAGKLVVTFSVKPDKGGENQVVLDIKVTCTKPEIDLPSSIFFYDSEFNLTRTDPNQGDLSFTDVSSTRPKPENRAPGITGDQLAKAQGVPA